MATAPQFRYSHEERDNVVVQDLTGWNGETDGMDRVEQEWMNRASRPHITGSVTEFNAEMDLGTETQNHLAREWSENAETANIDRIAFVSEGIKARAVSANIDVSQDVRVFGSVDEAVEWAQG